MTKADGYSFMIGILINYSVSHFTLSWFLLFSFILFPDVFYKDKLQKILDTLFATPVSISDVLMGKSLAISVICLIIVWLEQIVIILGVNLIYKTHNILIPDLQAILISLLITPVLGFAVVLLIGIITFSTNKYRILCFIFPFFVVGFFFFSAYKMKNFQPDWTTFYVGVFISFSLLLLSIVQLKKLSKEDIVTGG
jgi:ABC-type Na+ efflux pump permease subunit